MTSPLSSDIPKPVASTEKVVRNVATSFMPIPAYSDMGKAANDLINKDFYHTSQATLDVKLRAPNGTNVTVKGKQGFDGVTSGSIEGKHSLSSQKGRPPPDSSSSSSTSTFPSQKKRKKQKSFISLFQLIAPLPSPLRTSLYLHLFNTPTLDGINSNTSSQTRVGLTFRHSAGVSITQAWTTASLLDSKIELADVAAPGVKIDLQNLWNPSKPSSAAQKINLAFKNPNVHSRAFLNYAQASGNIDAIIDVTAGHEGFLVGGEAAYDVQKAAVTRYGVGLGYQTPEFTANITGMQNLSIIAASFYQRVNAAVEVGAKAGYDVQASKASGLELASKYKLDSASFAKAKINDRGIAALAYSTKLNAGTTIGLGLSLDTQKLNEAGHKIGTSLTFQG